VNDLFEDAEVQYEAEGGDTVMHLPEIKRIGRRSLGKALRTTELEALGLLSKFDKESSNFVEKTARYESAEFQRAVQSKEKQQVKLRPIRRKKRARQNPTPILETEGMTD